jgi:hypothetical protein
MFNHHYYFFSECYRPFVETIDCTFNLSGSRDNTRYGLAVASPRSLDNDGDSCSVDIFYIIDAEGDFFAV